MNRSKHIVYLFLGVFAFIFFVILYIFIFNFQDLVVNYKNIKSVGVYSENGNLIKTIKLTGERNRLEKGNYSLRYFGVDGYSDGARKIELKDKAIQIYLDPGFSEKRLSSLLERELSNLEYTIKSSNKLMSLYRINKGTLYNKGEWYATTLTYVGNDDFNADTLKVVLNKKDVIWKIINNPPGIVVSKNIYKQIPDYIVDDINSERPPLDSRFLY